jgi:hypothetical protein
MGKRKRNVKSLMAKPTCGKLNRLMNDDIVKPQNDEDEEQRRAKKLAYFFRMRDKELNDELLKMRESICPKCHLTPCHCENHDEVRRTPQLKHYNKHETKRLMKKLGLT